MTTTTDTPSAPLAPAPASDAGPAPAPLSTPLPEIPTPLDAGEITRRLDLAARRGRLPGYAATEGAAGTLFEVRDFGAPFEGVLRARLEGGVLRFSTAVQPRVPAIMAVILLLTIWPGVWFTESALASFFPSTPYMWEWTWWWYLPLAIASAPWVMWSAMKKSRASIHSGAHELIGKIAAELK